MSARKALPVRHPQPADFVEPWVVWCDLHGVIGVAPTYARARRAAARRGRSAGVSCHVRAVKTSHLHGKHAAPLDGGDA